MSALEIIADAQAVLTQHLEPGGLTKKECIDRLLAILDKQEAAQLTAGIRTMREARRRFEAATAALFIEWLEAEASLGLGPQTKPAKKKR